MLMVRAPRRRRERSTAFREFSHPTPILRAPFPAAATGVLVPTNAQWFSVTAMMLLKLLVQTTGAQIVLSSRWRITQLTRSIVEKRLAVDGLSLHSCTPNSVDGGADNRALEIVEWLENAEKRGDVVAEWVVLDDAPVEKLDPRMKNHW
eukprot:TRINITY_DN352_c0_g1_i1.p2 TRINITY_DN352_c0_g1~~TRINITY_DN352_c0_g1_i1.p2  ORF type:complete len:149 (-),score=25.90 TRINITY_DN352_c0_g1_i1:264-710(-)